jgi:hypothetical protein
MTERDSAVKLRFRLVEVALQWQERFGVAPGVTSAISELDGALLVGMTEDEYCSDCAHRTAVTPGCDFMHRGCRYQVKANRPSGRPGSFVTLVGKANNFDWDKLIWILYDRSYVIQEAWEWDVDEYVRRFDHLKRLSPAHLRQGRRLFPADPQDNSPELPVNWRPLEFGDIPSREEFERLTIDLLCQGIENSDRIRDEIRQRRKLILSRATGNWNETPSDKFVNDHAWVLEDLVVRKIIEKTAEKHYRIVVPEGRP